MTNAAIENEDDLWAAVVELAREGRCDDMYELLAPQPLPLVEAMYSAHELVLDDWEEEDPSLEGLTEEQRENLGITLSILMSPLNPHPQSGEGIFRAISIIEEDFGCRAGAMFTNALDHMPLGVVLNIINMYDEVYQRREAIKNQPEKK